MIRLYEAIQAHLGHEHRPIMRRQIARFAGSLAPLYEALEDWPALRRTLWKLAAADLRLPGLSRQRALRAFLFSHFPFLARLRRRRSAPTAPPA